MPLRKPVSFREAESYLAARRDRPTALNSREYLALWDRETRQRAFFSARVASADILAELHMVTQRVVEGTATEAQAAEWMRDFFENDGRGLLEAGGWLPREAAGNRLTELSSKRRLQLIVYQNAKIAQEIGHYQQWAQIRDRRPYGRWRLGYAEEHREEHVRRDGNVYPFEHPIWTQSPPGSEFNCHCWREELTREQVRAEGLTPEPLDSEFQPGTVDFDPTGGVDLPPPVKEELPPEIRAELRKALGMPPEEPPGIVQPPRPPPTPVQTTPQTIRPEAVAKPEGAATLEALEQQATANLATGEVRYRPKDYAPMDVALAKDIADAVPAILKGRKMAGIVYDAGFRIESETGQKIGGAAALIHNRTLYIVHRPEMETEAGFAATTRRMNERTAKTRAEVIASLENRAAEPAIAGILAQLKAQPEVPFFTATTRKEAIEHELGHVLEDLEPELRAIAQGTLPSVAQQVSEYSMLMTTTPPVRWREWVPEMLVLYRRGDLRVPAQLAAVFKRLGV